MDYFRQKKEVKRIEVFVSNGFTEQKNFVIYKLDIDSLFTDL